MMLSGPGPHVEEQGTREFTAILLNLAKVTITIIALCLGEKAIKSK